MSMPRALLPRPVLRVWRSHEGMRFLVVGALNTVLGYAVFALAFLLLEDRLHYLAILVIGHCCSVTAAFLAHRRFVFRSTGAAHRQFLRYNRNHLGLVAASLVLLPFLVEVGRLHPVPGQGIVVLTTALLAYPLHKHLSFGDEHE